MKRLSKRGLWFSRTVLVSDDLTQLIEPLYASRVRKHIAFSGGVDSTVLLTLLANNATPEQKDTLHAVHINHAWSASSDEWEAHCRRYARALGVAYTAIRVDARVAKGDSPEEVARRVRYDALCELVGDGELLLTAHHRDDQAVTVLLQMLRSAGPLGLAGMPEQRAFGKGFLVRPLLKASREQIETYARGHKLDWLEDEGNLSLRYDRNYIRMKLAPLLNARWPQWHQSFAHVASHQAEAVSLLAAQTSADYEICKVPDDDMPALSVERMARLERTRRKQLIRHWIHCAGLRMPRRTILERTVEMADEGCGDGILTMWNDEDIKCSIRCYRGRLYIVTSRECDYQHGRDKVPAAKAWRTGSDLELPEVGARLSWRELVRQAPQLENEKSLSVHFRRGGERCVRRAGEHIYHQDLKKVFQQHGCPPWRRCTVPLVYAGDELRLVWGIASFA